MRFFLIPVSLIILASCNSADQKATDKKVESRHGQAFNQSIAAMMNDYYALSEAFVKWDSNTVNAKTAALENSLGSVKLDDLKPDTAAYMTARETLTHITANADEIKKSSDLTGVRDTYSSRRSSLNLDPLAKP